jgi:pimeloyl-ACP methyl ester carboxylesterase
MAELAPSGFLDIGKGRNECRLAYRHWGPQPKAAPTLILLHEGLGSADLWVDFPERLSSATGLGVFAFSRRGYGASSPYALPWAFSYMHDEATDILGLVLDAIGFRKGLLIGASDGASIATVYAGALSDTRVKGLVLIAPHFVVEEETAAGANAAKVMFEQGDLKPKLARWHTHVDTAFYGWNATWTNPAFKLDWDISGYLPKINVPIRILQGERDEYATIEQIRIAERLAAGPVDATLLPGIGHSVFREAPAETTAMIATFVQELLSS